MAAGARIARRLPTCRRPAAAAAKAEDERCCGGFLPWLRSMAGADVSSVLRVGASPLGRSLFASRPIREGDCMMQVPHSVQLTEDKIPEEVRRLLDDGVAGDTTKIAVLLMMEQHLGQGSRWAPYVMSLPCKDQMHNMMFWDLSELHMVQNSSICDETIIQKEQVRKQFSALKPGLERFPHLFGEIKLGDFMHASALVSSRAWQTSRGVSLIPFADFLNHDGDSDSILIHDEQKDVSEVIADRNYAIGEQVMIRYGKYSNATLALNFGFTLSRNKYDQAHIWIDISDQDPLYKKKIHIWEKHRTPKSEHMFSSGCTKTSFAIKGSIDWVSWNLAVLTDHLTKTMEGIILKSKSCVNVGLALQIVRGEVKYSGDKGIGIPQILRAFVRVFCATSTEELEEMAIEAAENDDRLARRPLKHAEREVHAHRKLLLHLDDVIQGHSTAIEQLEIVDDAASRSMHPFRKEMAKDILAGEVEVLRSARAWVANYCQTVKIS